MNTAFCWCVLGAIGLLEAVRGDYVVMSGLPLGAAIGWYAGRRTASRIDVGALPSLAPGTQLQSPVFAALRACTQRASWFLALFVVMGFFGPPFGVVGPLGGGMAFGLAIRWAIRIRRTVKIERQDGRRLCYEVVPVRRFRSRSSVRPFSLYWYAPTDPSVAVKPQRHGATR